MTTISMSHQEQTGDPEEVESEDEPPFVPPPSSWFVNNESVSSSWSSPPVTPNPTESETLGSKNDQTHLQTSSGAVMPPPARSTTPSSTSSPLAGGVYAAHIDSHHPLVLQSHQYGVPPAPMNMQAIVGNTHPSPSWKEMSSQVLPAAARELLSSSWRRIYYTARLSYAKSRKHRKYSDIGNNTGGIYLSNNNKNNSSGSFPFNEAELPPFSSLKWTDRQLVREWRTYLPSDDNHDKDEGDDHHNIEECLLGEDPRDEEDFDFARARALVPNPFPRPNWQKTDVCHQCHKPFGPTRLRHHCRMCGFSFCQSHSSSSHKLPHLGYDPEVPERVCDPCKRFLQDQNLAERVAWRLARCRDYSEGNLTPYFEMGLDSASEVALRITKAAIAMAKSIPLGAQATVAVETVDVLRRYGLHGIYGIMLRQEFLAAADLLRRALGINKTSWPLSVHELSAAIFYALAQHRAMRGLNPDREEIIHTLRSPGLRYQLYEDQSPQLHPATAWTDSSQDHLELKNTSTVRTTVPAVIDNFAMSEALSFHINPVIDDTDTYNPQDCSTLQHLNENFDLPVLRNPPQQNDTTNKKSDYPPYRPLSQPSGFSPVCDPVPDVTLSSLIFYAPIALNFIYATKEVDMQLLAAQQGWWLLYAFLEQDYESEKLTDRPASAIFLHQEKKTLCLAIRGTATIQDVITDIRQTPVPFPDPEPSDSGTLPPGKEEDWTNICRGQGLALLGMASAAVNLFREHIDALTYFAKQGYRIRITGHSLGGGVATMMGVLVMRHFERDNELARMLQLGIKSVVEESLLLRVYAYGTPSCLDAKLADSVDSFVTTVVLHDDVFPRLTPTSCRGLLKHLLHIRETWVKTHIEEDLRAVGERAKTAWRPKFRQSFTLGSGSSSTTTIKKYCKKQFQKGKKTLLSVTEKISRLDSKDPGDHIEDNFLYADAESYQSDPSDWGERFFVPKTESSLPPTVKATSEQKDDTELEERDDSAAKPLPQLLLEFLGGVDTQTEGVVIDGEKFFDSEDKLIESDGEESVSTDCFRDACSTTPEHPLVVSDSWSLEPEMKPASPADSTKDSSSDTVGPAAVVLEETPLPRMFVPGKVIHIYSYRGVYKAVYVPRTFRELRRISLAGNMLSDHTTKCYYEGLLEVQTARLAPEIPPRWSAFDDDDTCCCCANRFTWASTSDSEAQEARDKHNCRSCGGLVCDPCAKNRVPIPSIGLTVPVRVCDRCYNDMGGHSVASSSLTSSILAVDEDEHHSRDGTISPAAQRSGTTVPDNEMRTDERPERRREKRSLVVDELASRMHASALTSCS